MLIFEAAGLHFVIHSALLTARAPDPLADELILAGYKITEAQWADEVLQLLETEHADVVVITHEVNDPDVLELQQKLMTLRLEPQATAKGVVCGLP
jgi:ABC-type nitrate/sulfonate/bicarbonate transport system ATPase subunit